MNQYNWNTREMILRLLNTDQETCEKAQEIAISGSLEDLKEFSISSDKNKYPDMGDLTIDYNAVSWIYVRSALMLD